MPITEKELLKIQGKGIAVKNRFKSDSIKVKIENPNLETISSLFSLLISSVIFKNSKELKISIKKTDLYIEMLDMSIADLISQLIETLNLIASIFNFSLSVFEKNEYLYLKILNP